MHTARLFLASFILVVSVVLISGCETGKGFVLGLGATVGGTAMGVGKDSVTAWKGIKKADDWFKENLW
ncbi:MAG: hypothetical protein NT079_00150 [Candidatus Omnitrophica bacterium]|nr:hypothetical protein [Candidatus Omnitrophota bacterium]